MVWLPIDRARSFASRTRGGVSLLALLAMSSFAGDGAAAPPDRSERNLFGRPMTRGGFHFLVAFGWAGGTTSSGLLHSMEVGGTVPSVGWTLAYNHVFVHSDGFFEGPHASDLFGGHLLVMKVPVATPEVVGKFGFGLGENVDLSDGFDPVFGLGWTYGIDVHVPAFEGSGPTLTTLGVHAQTPDRGHQAAAGVGLGYTWF